MTNLQLVSGVCTPPIRFHGKSFRLFSAEITSTSVYIELMCGVVLEHAEKCEAEGFPISETAELVEKALKNGELPEGFRSDDFC